MTEDANGRLVEVKSRFYCEAVKPGGVGRSGARMAAHRSIAALKTQVEQQLSASVVPLVALLRGWPGGSAVQGCELAALVRDVAGLADMHLLTEVAMHSFDALDAVLVDGVAMTRAEASCFADALVFAQQPSCRGIDVEPYAALLKDLEALTTLIIERGQRQVRQRA